MKNSIKRWLGITFVFTIICQMIVIPTSIVPVVAGTNQYDSVFERTGTFIDESFDNMTPGAYTTEKPASWPSSMTILQDASHKASIVANPSGTGQVLEMNSDGAAHSWKSGPYLDNEWGIPVASIQDSDVFVSYKVYMQSKSAALQTLIKIGGAWNSISPQPTGRPSTYMTSNTYTTYDKVVYDYQTIIPFWGTPHYQPLSWHEFGYHIYRTADRDAQKFVSIDLYFDGIKRYSEEFEITGFASDLEHFKLMGIRTATYDAYYNTDVAKVYFDDFRVDYVQQLPPPPPSPAPSMEPTGSPTPAPIPVNAFTSKDEYLFNINFDDKERGPLFSGFQFGKSPTAYILNATNAITTDLTYDPVNANNNVLGMNTLANTNQSGWNGLGYDVVSLDGGAVRDSDVYLSYNINQEKASTGFYLKLAVAGTENYQESVAPKFLYYDFTNGNFKYNTSTPANMATNPVCTIGKWNNLAFHLYRLPDEAGIRYFNVDAYVNGVLVNREKVNFTANSNVSTKNLKLYAAASSLYTTNAAESSYIWLDDVSISYVKPYEVPVPSPSPYTPVTQLSANAKAVKLGTSDITLSKNQSLPSAIANDSSIAMSGTLGVKKGYVAALIVPVNWDGSSSSIIGIIGSQSDVNGDFSLSYPMNSNITTGNYEVRLSGSGVDTPSKYYFSTVGVAPSPSPSPVASPSPSPVASPSPSPVASPSPSPVASPSPSPVASPSPSPVASPSPAPAGQPVISYSEMSPTNNDVIATLTFDRDISTIEASDDGTVTKISNKIYTYSFSNNKSVTFSFKDTLNVTGSSTINVTWIDKIAPSISGVKSLGYYMTSVKISFSDGTAVLNGMPIPNNTVIENSGTYELTVSDTVGNSNTIYFTVLIPRSSGGGSSSGGSIPIIFPPVVTPIPSSVPPSSFSDIENQPDWAKQAIDALVKKGIVKGKTDTKFDPESSVSREEMAKMLVEMLGIYDETATTSFSDVPADSWFYKYVASAEKAGITTGNGKGQFGSFENITREDIAVMIVRALNSSGKTLTEVRENTAFTDNNAVSNYANDSITLLYRAGIIDGMSDGTYAPKELLTRAQASKLIYKVLEALNMLS